MRKIKTMVEKNLRRPEITTERTEDDKNFNLRPKSLDQFIGQNYIKSNLKTYIESAKKRKKNLDHIILYGPPGLGKTSLAHIISNEKNVNFHSTSGPAFTKKGDLVTLLSNLMDGDVLFIDEIHRLPPIIEETLYPALEDFKCDYVIGSGPSARVMQISIEKFTLIGATTRLGLLSRPLRDRFGIHLQLDFYETNDLAEIIILNSKKLNFSIDADAASEIAKRSRGTPRIAIRLLKRVIDFSIVDQLKIIDILTVKSSLKKMKIDFQGLDEMDRKYMKCIALDFNGGPVGIETISAALLEQRDIIEDVIEPYLMQKGLVQRTSRGRILSKQGLNHISNDEK
ncbi:MAG: Holliday junction branch migration DNA helicase RuvB [Alphaproteobacteria bacterium]